MPDPSMLVGIEDAYEHTQLVPGETVAFCKRDQVAYHLSTWVFLKAQNQGNCCICGQADSIVHIGLPGAVPTTVPSWPPIEIPGFAFGERIINLAQVPEYIGRAVVVEGFVYEVYKTNNTGTVFVRFEPRGQRGAPFDGFKVVIFPKYLRELDQLELDPKAYQGRYVQVRGLIQKHPFWGIQILVNSPRVGAYRRESRQDKYATRRDAFVAYQLLPRP